MNTLLIPLDFSETSDNALSYAVGLANYLVADIVLLHVVPLPMTGNGYEVLTYTVKDSLEAARELLKQKSSQLKSEHGLLGDVSFVSEVGDLNSIINDYTSKKAVDLIVMGISGYGTKAEQVLFGSNAVSVSRESKVPVLIIPKSYQYKRITGIAYASQYDCHMKEHLGLIQIKDIGSIFNAQLNVLHVIPDNHLIDQAEAEADLYVEEKLENTNHKTFILSQDRASVALLDFINAHHIDIIVLEQKKQSFFHRLIYPSTTKEVAFNSPIPILTIHS
jgi:nucleotide-binding universal stress UspA family protein